MALLRIDEWNLWKYLGMTERDIRNNHHFFGVTAAVFLVVVGAYKMRRYYKDVKYGEISTNPRPSFMSRLIKTLPSSYGRRMIAAMWYPSLTFNKAMNKLGLFQWWTRIDDNVILGALLLEHEVDSLIEKENLKGVINTCDEYQSPESLFKKKDIKLLYLPTLDYISLSLDKLWSGVHFLDEMAKSGSTVYVHCKAGRGRSPTLVLCYLMFKYGLTPRDAQTMILRKRPHVTRNLYFREEVQMFYSQLCALRGPQQQSSFSSSSSSSSNSAELASST